MARARQQTYSLDDKVVFLTGAGGGLGAATAALLTHRGAQVALADIDVSAAERTARTLPPAQVLPVDCDVTAIDSVRAAVRKVEDQFGRIDVAIANAGLMGRGGTFRTLATDEVNRVLSVNVSGVLNTVSATIESVIQNRGQIALVSSVFAYLNGAGAMPYAMSKAAVEQAGRALAVELASHGATAMTAYFSLIETGMIQHGIDEDPHVQALLSAMPKFILKRIQPTVAATAIVNGLEQRRRTVCAPARWRPVSALRGVLGPLVDARLARDIGVQRALTELDTRHGG
ncbi:SDR family NAD(P)-dependent oxidoreductase [Mycobacterium sp. CBMA293]|uniref:SDR family NAD(P)-dependent oxidoreductase n=1 Tax=unclassified Mycolicibacterium TaxID=2636767 RepID=UPI0012DD4B72|nr:MULTISPECIES: SDR family NAD(P)-dependent oxidoreductase [unclassified Mycolicibacterium]MUL48226.1 SDR family NAD(P)-dependent oxidoreductase [Mycolicibacterium sp. CBMA 360]MUL57606.1 SDR family NAD(P)-dependent oxidoreductase [Mycolicibacterium sp. CBMA 335]MUL70646.1 SDR family NAD(P)-dependent oxidoreductase [Mycolicibacterium sp. CBMA 311]MUL92694.1 SDR family NAD(P)-dependent oxidoreductase [Mycolicibacterium sp. CBMA 230]MUM08293.1 oxidoreductase [Mycolicibacterium sp. CBMA 213]